MRGSEKISNAIGNVDERFLQEVMKHKANSAVGRRIRRAAFLVASLCLAMGTAVFLYQGRKPSVKVYARESGQEFLSGKTIMMPGTIDDDGEMKGPPLMFYVQGSGIKSIRFSCRSEWISFVDWTEQRDGYGYSKNFTIPYGERAEDYYYLVVDWEPRNIIRKLTDDGDVKITDLAPEEREDAIVMEVTYLNGEQEVLIMNVSLDDQGRFMASVSDYEITPSDDFVFRQDAQPIKDRTESDGIRATEQSPAGTTSDVEAGGDETAAILSEEGLAVARQAIEEYYVTINRQLIDYVQAEGKRANHLRAQEEFEGEVVVFRVSVEGSEAERYIVLGSPDGWEHCVVLNEGY